MALEVSVSAARLTEQRDLDSLSFNVTLSAPAPTGGIAVSYRVLPGTALEVLDYLNEPNTLRIAAGQTSGTINVRVRSDTLDETDENLTLELFNPVGAVFAGDAPALRATGVILDDDGIGSNLALSVSSPVLLEGNTGTKAAHIEATLSRAATTTINVPYQTVNGTAVAGQDYVGASGTLSFAPGQTVAAVDVTVNGDTTSEPGESFSLVLTPPPEIASGANGAVGQVTILDDDAAAGGLPSVTVSNAQLTEQRDLDSLSFNVTLSAPAPSGGVAISYRVLPGTALEVLDYLNEPNTLRIAAGQTSGTINVRVRADTLDETDENLTLELFNPIGAVFAGDAPALRATGVILDDDGIGPNLALSVSSPVLLEGNTGTRTAHIEATLSRAATATITVPYQTVNGTAIAGQDYVAASGSLTFAPGQTVAAVDVTINGDTTSEPGESFNLVLTPPGAVASGINGAVAQVMILDDDAAAGGQPSVTVSTAQLTEQRDLDSLSFNVTLSAPAPSSGITVQYRVLPGTAQETSDYLNEPNTLRIAAGQTSGTINVRIRADTLDETDENLTLELFNPVGAVFAGDAPMLRATGIILDDDGIGSNLALSTLSPVLLEGATGTKTAHVEATLSRAQATAITVPYQTVNGTAIAGQDYVAASGSLTFAPGQTVAAVDVTINGDLNVEATESLSVQFSAPTAGPAFAPASATITITNDDVPASLNAAGDVVFTGDNQTLSIPDGSRTVRINGNNNLVGGGVGPNAYFITGGGNQLQGTAANDTIALTGDTSVSSNSDGTDTYVFRAGVDGAGPQIAGFAAGQDNLAILLNPAANTGLTDYGLAPMSFLSAAQFERSAAPTTAGTRFTYDPATGALRFTPRGSASSESFGVARLPAGLGLQAGQVFISNQFVYGAPTQGLLDVSPARSGFATAVNPAGNTTPVARFAVTDSTTGIASSAEPGEVLANDPNGLAAQFVYNGADVLAVATQTAENVFVKSNSSAQVSALAGGAGNDVLDGGLGSVFLTGGAGRDFFFTDARQSQFVWTTVADFSAREVVTLWGFQQGRDSFTILPREGASGFEGVTLEAQINGAAPALARVTLSGRTAADFVVSYGEAGGGRYLAINSVQA